MRVEGSVLVRFVVLTSSTFAVPSLRIHVKAC